MSREIKAYQLFNHKLLLYKSIIIEYERVSDTIYLLKENF